MIESRRIHGSNPTLVFLHEGLGSAAQWRDFPDSLAQSTGCGAFVYSRYGYGGSDPVTLPRPVTYMHDEAAILADLLEKQGIADPILVGHSDGASITLIHAFSQRSPLPRSAVVMAPHVFVEDISVRSIAAARVAWETTDLREKLKRWHGENVDCAFLGWNGAWLDPAFRDWSIESGLPGIRCPLLVIQGADDEYGTLEQVRRIERGSGGPVETLVLPDCGHAPQRDQPAKTLDAVSAFVRRSL